MRTVARVIACGVAVASLAVVVFAVALDRIAARAGVADVPPVWIAPFVFGAVAAPAAVGALVLLRRPGNAVGWILVVGALSFAVTWTGEAYARVALIAHPGSLPGGAWAAVVGTVWPTLYAWPLAVAFLFPDGRLPSPRWRLAAALAAAALAALVFGLIFGGDRLEEPFSGVDNPVPHFSEGASAFVVFPALAATLASLALGATAIRVRYRRSSGTGRLQLLWLAYAVLLLPLGLAACALWQLLFGDIGAGPFVVLLVMHAAIATSVAIAVTRYRLYEIDRLINRTLVYAIVTVALVLLFAGVSLVAGVVAGRGSTWATAIATLVVALAFARLRARVQAFVDWRFARPRYEGLKRVRAFVDDVRDGRAQPEDVGLTLARALRDPTAELVFRLPATDTYVDRFGRNATIQRGQARVGTRVEHDGQELAVLLHDDALLHRPDLLRSVLAAATLAIEIARLRLEVRMQLAEVEESRARIVEAGYEERRRLARDLHDGAQQRLVTLGIVLRRLQRALPKEARTLAPALDAAVDEVGQAISDLRTIAAGLRPRRLDEGLAAALADLARAAPVPVDVEATPDRLPSDVEAAAYFVASEALTNAVKHASASRVRVTAAPVDGGLRLIVADDGVGGATTTDGTGLEGLADRVRAHRGTLVIDSPPGGGTRIEAVFPCGS